MIKKSITKVTRLNPSNSAKSIRNMIVHGAENFNTNRLLSMYSQAIRPYIYFCLAMVARGHTRIEATEQWFKINKIPPIAQF